MYSYVLYYNIEKSVFNAGYASLVRFSFVISWSYQLFDSVHSGTGTCIANKQFNTSWTPGKFPMFVLVKELDICKILKLLLIIHVCYWQINADVHCKVKHVFHSLLTAVHEKIFVVFMITSCCYMLLNTLIYQWTRTDILTPTVSSWK